nr:hypothetical protein [Tanacetum cinerariifolium]
QTSSLKLHVPNVNLEKIIIDLEDEVVSLLEKEKVTLKTIESLKSKDLDTFSSVRRPKHSGVIWKKKGSSNTSNVDLSSVSLSKLNKNVKRYSRKDLLSCNSSHLNETSSASVCNDAINVSCNSRMCDVFDDINFFIFDDESVRISLVSKMPFRKKPRDSINIVQIFLWIINLGCSKHVTGNRALLTNFVVKFFGTVRFGNNDFAVIAGYGDVVIGSMTINKVYYVEGLGHNLFSVGKFCEKGLDVAFRKFTCFVRNEDGVDLLTGLGHNLFSVGKFCEKGLDVAFRKFTCFVRNEDGVDLLTGDRSSNLYSIALNEVASNSSTCLLEKASSSQSWLWHQRLSHLNFTTINNLVKNNLVQGLPKMKFEKDLLCFACEQGKIHRKHQKSKTAFASIKPLYLLHMDLCGPMRVESINGKRYVLVVVDACSRCYLLNDYEDVGKLKENRNFGVFVGYSKESAAFRIYNKRTRKIHESVNVNFNEISEMAYKQFSLEPGLSNLNEIEKSSNPSVLKVSEASKKDLEDLFQNFYDEYFDSSKIMKSSTTNVETSINEEVFHEVSESFQGESSSSSLNDDVQQSPEE